MCNSSMSTEIRGHSFDTNQNETMEKSALEWDEQLEKEIFSGKCVSLFWYCLIVLLPEVTVAVKHGSFLAEWLLFVVFV